MNIVFLVGNYYPNYSAVGKCVANVAEELSRTHNVTVITKLANIDQEIISYYNNQKLIRINTRFILKRLKMQNNLSKSNGIKKKIYRFLLNIIRIRFAIKTILSRVTIDRSLVKAYYEELKRINEPIDLIIPSSMPFETVVAAALFKKDKNPKVFAYLFDQFTANENLHRLKINKHIKWKANLKLEKKVFSMIDYTFAMHSLKKHFYKYHPDVSQIEFVEHPLLKDPSNKIYQKKISKKIIVSYVGGLYKGYVEPKYVLDIFSSIRLDSTVLNFYIIGNFDKIVDKYAKKSDNTIINHGEVSREESNFAISNSQILINISEKNGVQMSSKIFDYISYGKPIIHFYSVDEDVNLRVLSRYDNVLLIKQNYRDFELNKKKVMNFIIKNKNKVIPFSSVVELYKDASPLYTVNLILSKYYFMQN